MSICAFPYFRFVFDLASEVRRVENSMKKTRCTLFDDGVETFCLEWNMNPIAIKVRDGADSKEIGIL
jgi:hypothetical protein